MIVVSLGRTQVMPGGATVPTVRGIDLLDTAAYAMLGFFFMRAMVSPARPRASAPAPATPKKGRGRRR